MTQKIGQLALIGFAALTLAACATSEPAVPAYPITAPAPAPEPSPPPPPPPPPQDNGVVAAPTAPVTSQPLAPTTTAPATPPIPEERPNPPPQYYPAPAPAPAPTAAAPPPPVMPREVTIFSVTGRVVDAEGPPKSHTVKRGDTIDAIAREFGITRKQLVDANKIDDPSKIRPGQKLKGPTSKAKAYIVGGGDTLFAISRRFNVTAAALAETNDRSVNDPIRAGQRLVLPQGFKDTGPLRRTAAAPTPPAPVPYTPPVTAAAPPPPAYAPPATAAAPLAPAPTPPTNYARPAPTPPAATPPTTYARPAPTPAPAIIDTAAPPSDQDVIVAGRGRFVWPLQGEILATFGPKGTGQRSDGINIRAGAAAPIRAAAAGEVVYAGDQVPEFGNLVLVKHADGWVTAYAHLAKADVRMRQVVTQGQQIGTAGMSGGVPEPQLHFEVRYAPTPKDKARPIDPTLVLPR